VSLKPLSLRKVMKALGVLGFERVRQRGSHVVLKHPDVYQRVFCRVSVQNGPTP
jgi:predicted RNA binding protein YcfA (HicA-like mRNA interferase family)